MRRIALPLLISLCTALPAHADEAELRAKIDKLTAELEALKTEIKTMNSRTEALADQQEAMAAQTPATGAAGGASSASPLSVWGYGEVNYNRPTDNGSDTTADLRRAVLGFGYQFDEATRLSTEFEIEHAIASADDEGEVEVEQFVVDHTLAPYASVKAGLFLMPVGLLNESHEPTAYYGVERNFVETAIIPTTWREGGVGVYGTTGFGLAWDAGITTGFDLGKWDPTSGEGRESPLGSIHQELQLARARDLATYVSLNYRGIPGWDLGGSVFTGKAAHDNPDLSLASDSRVTLWEAHTRWTPGNFDLSALYAKGTISDTAALNTRFAGSPTLIPKEFWGWYLEGAYRIGLRGGRGLSPFVRYERFNTGEDYEPLPAGLSVDALPTETVWTAGLNFELNRNVVLKLDYQDFKESTTGDRVDLGLGVAF